MGPDLIAGLVSLAVLLQSRKITLITLALQQHNQILQRDDARRRHAVLASDLSHSTLAGLAVINALLLLGPGHLLQTVQSDRKAHDLTALLGHEVQRLTHGGARGDDVVNDQHVLALQSGADNVAALAVVLGLLAVVAVGDGGPGLGVQAVEFEEGCGGKGNALVCGTEGR